MRKILWGAAVACVVGAIPVTLRFWGGIVLFAIGLVLAFIAWKYKGDKQMQKDGEKTNVIKDSKFKAKVERADKATVLDIKSPTITENVEASLEARDVKDAAVVRTSQTLNIKMGTTCAHCHASLPIVSFGVKPTSIKCRSCGHVNKVDDNEQED